jgi:hypothetical protein
MITDSEIAGQQTDSRFTVGSGGSRFHQTTLEPADFANLNKSGLDMPDAAPAALAVGGLPPGLTQTPYTPPAITMVRSQLLASLFLCLVDCEHAPVDGNRFSLVVWMLLGFAACSPRDVAWSCRIACFRWRQRTAIVVLLLLAWPACSYTCHEAMLGTQIREVVSTLVAAASAACSGGAHCHSFGCHSWVPCSALDRRPGPRNG